MIQEVLFGGANTLIAEGERKLTSTNGSVLGRGRGVLLPHTKQSPSSSQPPCAPSTASITATAIATASSTNNTPNSATTTPSNSENQNLRCPRCDSSNTKFCYYNNYNLTQPRHFCKTCRRYWTKGGALRNVPIGGGCRKNKNVSGGVSSSTAKTGGAKMKTVASELGRSSSPGLGHGFDHEISATGPILWGSTQSTHLLALLKASQNQNPNPNLNPSLMSLGVVSARDEGNMMASQSHVGADSLLSPNGVLNSRALGYDSMGQGPSLGLCSSFFARNNNQDQLPQQTNGGFSLGEHQNSGIQDLYQKLRASSANYYCSDNSPVLLGNMASNIYSSSSSSSSISNILESTSVSGGELGYWNPTLSWSDLPTTNGAYP